MSNSVLTLITNASRPFKSFETEFEGEKVTLYTRRLSAAETSILQKVYADEVARVKETLQEDGGDLVTLRHNFGKQTKEKLAKFIVAADRTDYMLEASSELDDADVSDPRVTELCEAKMEEAERLLQGAEFDEVLDMAIDRRAFVLSASRASQIQNRYLLYYSVYCDELNEDGSPTGNKIRLFPSEEYVETELDTGTIDQLLMGAFTALGPSDDSPLNSAAKKPSRKRTSSQKPLVEASQPSDNS